MTNAAQFALFQWPVEAGKEKFVGAGESSGQPEASLAGAERHANPRLPLMGRTQPTAETPTAPIPVSARAEEAGRAMQGRLSDQAYEDGAGSIAKPQTASAGKEARDGRNGDIRSVPAEVLADSITGAATRHFDSAQCKREAHEAAKRPTQAQRILKLLECGEWVPLWKIARIAAMYPPRIKELRAMGYDIRNRRERVEGVTHSFYRLVR